MSDNTNHNVIFNVTDIDWDTEDNGEVVPQYELGLPSKLTIEYHDIMKHFGFDYGEYRMRYGARYAEDYIADFLSDEYGYCVLGYCVERINQ